METLVVTPRNKAELGLLKTMLKKMDIKSKVIGTSKEHDDLKNAMLAHSKRFFIEKIDK